MIYFKLGQDMTLHCTQPQPLMQGDALTHELLFLIPKTITSATLKYTRPDGASGEVELSYMEEYNDDYNIFKTSLIKSMTVAAGWCSTRLALTLDNGGAATSTESGWSVGAPSAAADVTIKQGDAYALPIALDYDDSEEPELVELYFGDQRFVYPGDMTFEEGILSLPLTQSMTQALQEGTIEVDIRVRFTDGTVIGIPEKLKVTIADAVSKVVI